MRWFHGVLVSFLFGLLVVACNTVDPGECWPNTSGGLGGGPETIPIGAGVGATSSGDFITPPPKWPLGNGDAPDNPCVLQESPPKSPSPSTCQVDGTTSDGTTFTICSDTCKTPCAGVHGYSASLFKFVTIVADDGSGKAGGWQAASVVLRVKRWVDVLPESWSCPQMTFGTPLRNELQGKISAEMAASVSAELATQVSGELKNLPQGIFCIQLREDLKVLLGKAIFGAKVTQP